MAPVTRLLCAGMFFCCVLWPQAQGALRLGEKGLKFRGFLETAVGVKLGEDSTKHDEYNLLEQRLQLKTEYFPASPAFLADWMAQVSFRGDFTLDEYFAGKTAFDLRELSAVISPFSWMDLRAGRQVFTWGTGDYLFINDLFPKDYVSFYTGRDDEYLKKPSDGLRLSLYSQKVNFEIIAIPFFEPNTLFTGERLSFFDSFQAGIAGRASDRQLTEPGRQLRNAEYAGRLYRHFGSYEAALYVFRGFHKSPQGYLNESMRELFYPRLDAYGGSIRGPMLSGIVNAEFAYYNSPQDTKGDNRLIPNSMVKYMMGYSRDLGNDTSAGVQYFCEWTLDYGALRDNLLAADYRWDEFRHLATFRVTKLFKNQTVKANLFAFFSPSDLDVYLRPGIDYDVSDNLKVSFGANLVWGRDDHTEFGQMERNKNVYIRVRFSF